MNRPVFLNPPSTALDEMPAFGWRTVRRRLPGVAYGTIAGALAAFLLVELGLPEIIGGATTQAIALCGAVVGGLLGLFRLQRFMAGFDALLALVFLVAADTPIMDRVAPAWVRNDPVKPVDAIVVLSAGVNSSGMLNDQAVQRLLTGLQLFHDGVAPRIFTTAVEAEFGSIVRSSTGDQERLVTLGGAHSAWTSLTGVFTTHDEALQAASQLPPGAHSVAVVTSPMHTRRACATFEAVGFHVVCVASREHSYVGWHPFDSPDRLDSFRQYFYERLGMVKYRAKGWLPKTP